MLTAAYNLAQEELVDLSEEEYNVVATGQCFVRVDWSKYTKFEKLCWKVSTATVCYIENENGNIFTQGQDNTIGCRIYAKEWL